MSDARYVNINKGQRRCGKCGLMVLMLVLAVFSCQWESAWSTLLKGNGVSWMRRTHTRLINSFEKKMEITVYCICLKSEIWDNILFSVNTVPQGKKTTDLNHILLSVSNVTYGSGQMLCTI